MAAWTAVVWASWKDFATVVWTAELMDGCSVVLGAARLAVCSAELRAEPKVADWVDWTVC